MQKNCYLPNTCSLQIILPRGFEHIMQLTGFTLNLLLLIYTSNSGKEKLEQPR
jgi:hypothetical protein